MLHLLNPPANGVSWWFGGATVLRWPYFFNNLSPLLGWNIPGNNVTCE